ncbi:MAG TPA: UrcA family protein [Phenylobacterium sp.]|nr:UrcA family protein [Phenylobacterium sp.]
MKSIIAIATVALLSTLASQAAAQETAPMKAAVSYADLDLSRATGRTVLEHRVEQAINRVCPERPLPAELGKQQTYKACHNSAWAGAKRQLAEIYGGRQLADASVAIAGARH